MRGLTLIELLISLTIIMVLTGIISSVVITSNTIFRQKTSSLDILQNGNVLLGVLTREIRQSRRIITELEKEKNNPSSEIVFQDGHLRRTTVSGGVVSLDGLTVTLDNEAKEKNGFYNDLYIKFYQEGSPQNGEIKRVIIYDGEERKAYIESSLESFSGNENLNYLIDSNFYYVRYEVDDKMQVWRSVFAYYFTGSEDLYVPYNAVPPSNESIEEEILEGPQVVAEHVNDIFFWGEKEVNIFANLILGDRSINFYNKVTPRNI